MGEEEKVATLKILDELRMRVESGKEEHFFIMRVDEVKQVGRLRHGIHDDKLVDMSVHTLVYSLSDLEVLQMANACMNEARKRILGAIFGADPSSLR